MSVIVLFAACATNAQLPGPSSRTVDPMRDVVIIPQDVCPKFGGWIAKTQDAQALEEQILIESETRQRVALVDCQGEVTLARLQRDRALEAVDAAGWWQRWSGAVVAAGVVVGLGLGAAVGVALGRK